eukprot:5665266-Karenia_brevis.AAC.1
MTKVKTFITELAGALDAQPTPPIANSDPCMTTQTIDSGAFSSVDFVPGMHRVNDLVDTYQITMYSNRRGVCKHTTTAQSY